MQFMVYAAFSFSLMAAFVKLGGNRFPVQELIAFRSIFIIAVTLPIMLRLGVPILGNNRPKLFLRGLFGFVAMSCYFWTVTKLPVADAMVLQHTNPIFTTLLAGFFLKEKSSSQLWFVIALCLVGVVAVVKPGFGGDPIVALVGLAGAALAGAAYTTVRGLRATDNAYTIVFYYPLVSLPFSLIASAGEWVWPVGWEWGIIFAVCFSSYIGQIFMTKGLEREPAGRAVTVNYLGIAFGGLLGWLMFDQVPDVFSILGIILILGSITLLNRDAIIQAWRTR